MTLSVHLKFYFFIIKILVEYKQSESNVKNSKDNKPGVPAKDAGTKDKGKNTKDQKDNLLLNVNVEEELNKIFKNIFFENKQNDTRPHNSAIYFFKLNLSNLISYYRMARYEDCKQIINKLIEHSRNLSVINK